MKFLGFSIIFMEALSTAFIAVTACIWFSVGAAQGDAIAAAQRDFADAQLSPKALDEAQAQATRCFESNFKDCE